MGNLYRFIEPVLLFLLKRKGSSYGYELASEAAHWAFTGADLQGATLYRTLRQMERNGCVSSEWDVVHGGPARRLYRLTEFGEQHLWEWMSVLGQMARAMERLVDEANLERIAGSEAAAVGHPLPAGDCVAHR
jgi:DNA-binding PadR family transcriptional regulator